MQYLSYILCSDERCQVYIILLFIFRGKIHFDYSLGDEIEHKGTEDLWRVLNIALFYVYIYKVIEVHAAVIEMCMRKFHLLTALS